jgi:hypothetical protein
MAEVMKFEDFKNEGSEAAVKVGIIYCSTLTIPCQASIFSVKVFSILLTGCR